MGTSFACHWCYVIFWIIEMMVITSTTTKVVDFYKGCGGKVSWQCLWLEKSALLKKMIRFSPVLRQKQRFFSLFFIRKINILEKTLLKTCKSSSQSQIPKLCTKFSDCDWKSQQCWADSVAGKNFWSKIYNLDQHAPN